MATTSEYLMQMMQTSGVRNQTLQEIIAQLGNNPAVDNYKPAEKIDVTDPRLRTITEYLNELGAQDYQYKLEDILAGLNAASAAGQEVRQGELAQGERQYNRDMAAAQQTAADTIRNQYAAAIQSGMSKGMQNANLLSTLLGTSQQAAEGAQLNAEARAQAAKEYAAELAGNQVTALDKSNAAYQTLMGNIRQIFNDEIQEKTADLEYNASLEETLANYLASKYTADSNYAASRNQTAGNIYSSNQSALAGMAGSAGSAAAQDVYSQAYQAAAQAAADAQRYAADQSAAATRYAADQSARAQAAAASAYATTQQQAAQKAAVQSSVGNKAKTTGSSVKQAVKNIYENMSVKGKMR